MTTTHHRVVVNEVRRRVSRNDHSLMVDNTLGRPLDRGCRIETPLPGREAGSGRAAPSAGPRRVERPAAAAALDDRQAGTRESRPAEPAGRRGRPWRAVRRRPGGNGRRAGASHAEAAAALGARPNAAGRGRAAPRCALAAFGGAAPERWRGRASRRGEAPGSGSDPRHVVRPGAGNAADRAPAAGPGTGTELLIDTRDDPGGSCPPPARARSSPPARACSAPPADG